MSVIQIVYLALAAFTVYFVVVFARHLRQGAAAGESVKPRLSAFLIGTVANFFDTLGIGSFATTTTAFRAFKTIPDERLPGTLNAGYASAALFQSFLYIASVEVAPLTLTLMILAAVLGAWLGAGVFAKWPRQRIQYGMGAALLVAGVLFIMRNVKGDPVGGLLTELTGTRLVLGLAGNFVLGILMTIGIGLYGPCMLLVALLGMNPRTAFPIMMGSCAFLMPIAGGRFLKEKAVDLPAALAMSISALPGVYLAYRFFSSLDIVKVRWLVAFVVLYTGVMLLRTAMRGNGAPRAEPA